MATGAMRARWDVAASLITTIEHNNPYNKAPRQWDAVHPLAKETRMAKPKGQPFRARDLAGIIRSAKGN